ncbi:MAG: DUF192 domain-containing protein [Candidatus Dormibacteraceae bacterium]
MTVQSTSSLVHDATGAVLADRLVRPRTMLGRGLGLMFRARLDPGQGMWIGPCNGIHMFFMRFAIDAVFVDKTMRVVRTYRGLRPWRVVPLVRKAKAVFELPSGQLDALGLELVAGDLLRIQTDREWAAPTPDTAPRR